MTTASLDLVITATGGGGQRRVAAATSRLAPLIPVSFALAGALTGATIAQAPPSSLDWTSAQARHLIYAPAWASEESPLTRPVLTTARVLLDDVKRDTGLTWGQIASALGVDVRAVHLWRNGGGISASHEGRLHELAFLADSVRLDTPSDARAQLVSTRAGQSLLERFRAGASGHDAALLAPWRTEARDGLRRSAAAAGTGEPVDEEFLFLLYTDPAHIDGVVASASELLEDPSTSRRVWERHLERRFSEVEQPVAVQGAPVTTRTDDEADESGLAPLFDLEALDIALSVGAIASRPTLYGDA